MKVILINSLLASNICFAGYKVNTSNPVKLIEFRKYLKSEIIVEKKDLDEPDADPITVIQYKASQFNEVLVDDTSLDVEGENVGVNIRWLLKSLPQMAEKKATFVSLIGIRMGEEVHIFKGEVHGKIVAARGKNFGFLPYFLPDGVDKTMGEEIIDEYNARYYAIKNFIEGKPFKILPPLEKWDGNFQH